MDDTTFRALDLMLGAGLTTSPVDNQRAVLALRAVYDPSHSLYENNKDYQVVMDMILRKRSNFRCWLVQTQRKWQIHRRTVTVRSCDIRYKRNYPDKKQSIDIIDRVMGAEGEAIRTRERYVRCDGKDHSARGIEDFMAAL